MMLPEGSIKVLAQESLGEIIIWLLVFFVNAIFLGITSKNKTARMVIGGILLVAEVCLMSYGQAFSEIFLAVLETAFTEIIICLFPGMDVDITEIPFVFLMLFIPPRYFNSTDMVLAGSQVFLIILLAIFSFAIITGRIKKEPIILFYFEVTPKS
ncbi:MAG: hypothetical protein LIV11_06090 [Bacillota bacterium]|nr:hypothetical protein [Bacillota bacterium]